jgi:SAM-dependent methyltransferase
VRRGAPQPWDGDGKIPWHDPEFSARMLDEHLAQHHDGASRRTSIIDAQVRWMHEHLLRSQSARVLDLGCGPGLYTSRLAALGHQCHGIDFSPASIAYAQREATVQGSSCTYELSDIRTADYGRGYDLVMLISGELNVFRSEDAGIILGKAFDALAPGGSLLLEVHPRDAVREIGSRPARWTASESSPFSARPHVYLQEQTWQEPQGVAAVRYWVIDAGTSAVSMFGETYQAYSEDGFRSMLAQHGYVEVEFIPSLTGVDGATQDGFIGILARCPAD